MFTLTVSRRVAEAPGRGLAAGLAQHPPAEGQDEAGLLGQRDELGGQDQPRCGCCQRTSASKPRDAPVARATMGW